MVTAFYFMKLCDILRYFMEKNQKSKRKKFIYFYYKKKGFIVYFITNVSHLVKAYFCPELRFACTGLFTFKSFRTCWCDIKNSKSSDEFNVYTKPNPLFVYFSALI